jgi:hypothetical protein
MTIDVLSFISRLVPLNRDRVAGQRPREGGQDADNLTEWKKRQLASRRVQPSRRHRQHGEHANKASDEDDLRAGRPSFQERVPHADHESKEPPIGEARHPVRVARSKIATNGPAYDLRCALVTAARGNQRMSDTPQNDKSKQQIRHLRELIAALDKRVPRIERVGEASIARDAAALKKKALERLAELQADVEE